MSCSSSFRKNFLSLKNASNDEIDAMVADLQTLPTSQKDYAA